MDIFTCSFKRISAAMASNAWYDVLWKVNGEYLYEDTDNDNVTEMTLPTQYSNSIVDGTTVSLHFKMFTVLL